MMNELRAHTNLFRRRRSQESAYGGNYGAIESANHYRIALVECAVHQNDVDRHA